MAGSTGAFTESDGAKDAQPDTVSHRAAHPVQIGMTLVREICRFALASVTAQSGGHNACRLFCGAQTATSRGCKHPWDRHGGVLEGPCSQIGPPAPRDRHPSSAAPPAC